MINLSYLEDKRNNVIVVDTVLSGKPYIGHMIGRPYYDENTLEVNFQINTTAWSWLEVIGKKLTFIWSIRPKDGKFELAMNTTNQGTNNISVKVLLDDNHCEEMMIAKHLLNGLFKQYNDDN